jgi:hypothetical protein
MPDGSSSAAPVIKPGPRTEKNCLTKPDLLVFSFAILLKICFALALSQSEESRTTKSFTLKLAFHSDAETAGITTICSLSLADFHEGIAES